MSRTNHASQIAALRRGLLRWYDRSARDLPWRRLPDDPYAQWLAEMMLQQTQTATVAPYFEKFLERFPSVSDLASADRQSVLELWAGLGYYRRAHLLHDAARIVANDLGGRFPDTVEGLRTLPGVGRYTAGAIASVAFDRRAPILDGNVKRVLARVFAVREAPDEPRTLDRLWHLAEEILPQRRCGDFNQALMDLGATVCTPKRPACGDCPVKGHCAALQLGKVDVIPAPRRRAAQRKVDMRAFIVTSPRRILLVQRSAEGLWPGMTAFPSAETNGKTAFDAMQLLLPLPVLCRLTKFRPLGAVNHQLTHRQLRFEVFQSSAPAVRIRPPFLWTPLDDIPPLPNAFRKIFNLYRQRAEDLTRLDAKN